MSGSVDSSAVVDVEDDDAVVRVGTPTARGRWPSGPLMNSHAAKAAEEGAFQ